MPYYFPNVSEEQYLRQVNRGDDIQREQQRYGAENAAASSRRLGEIWGQALPNALHEYQQGRRFGSEMEDAEQRRRILESEEGRAGERFGEERKGWGRNEERFGREKQLWGRDDRRWQSEESRLGAEDKLRGQQMGYYDQQVSPAEAAELGYKGDTPLNRYQAGLYRTDASGNQALQNQRLAGQLTRAQMANAASERDYLAKMRAKAEADEALTYVAALPEGPERQAALAQWQQTYGKGALAGAQGKGALLAADAGRVRAANEAAAAARLVDQRGYGLVQDANTQAMIAQKLAQDAAKLDSFGTIDRLPLNSSEYDKTQEDVARGLEALGRFDQAKNVRRFGKTVDVKGYAASALDEAKAQQALVANNIAKQTRDLPEFQAGYRATLDVSERQKQNLDPLSKRVVLPSLTGLDKGPQGGAMTNAAFLQGQGQPQQAAPLPPLPPNPVVEAFHRYKAQRNAGPIGGGRQAPKRGRDAK